MVRRQDMYELVIIWETGEKEITPYNTEQEAEQAESNMFKAFGNQITWSGIRRKI